MPCHFAKHPRQHVAVACCAMKTGCPRIGVCFPSFAGAAGASRWAMNVAACSSTTALPFVIKYARSFGPSAKRRLNGDCANTSKSSSRLRTRLRIDCRGKSRSRRTRYFLTREWHHPLFQSMLATRLRPLNATDACSARSATQPAGSRQGSCSPAAAPMRQP